jgi:phosphotransferase system  glucose/maltose/N-acetylglucosamine-specific IIC component
MPLRTLAYPSMKSCLFIIVAVLILAGLVLSLGTLFFISSDTKVLEVEVETEETTP